MKRENGYYWVKFEYWVIAYYDNNRINEFGCGWDDYLDDGDFVEINETRILNPDELKEKQ
jgi:hypothetical protein